jgi:hypothetical protein
VGANRTQPLTLIAAAAIALAATAGGGSAWAQTGDDAPSDQETMRVAIQRAPVSDLPPPSELLGGKITVFVDGVECGTIEVAAGPGEAELGTIVADSRIGASVDDPSACRRAGAEVTFVNGYGHELFTRTVFTPGADFVLTNLAPAAYPQSGGPTDLPSAGSGGLAGSGAAWSWGVLALAVLVGLAGAAGALRLVRVRT